jgi:hypothetical protein
VTFVHFIIHSLINYFIAAIAYMYFPSTRGSNIEIQYNREAQLLAISMLSNCEMRSYFADMYNDEIMILYLILAVYFSLKSKPIVASFFVTMSLGVKAGSLLILPGFLGSV